ncbi:hypothetical protein [Pararhizobium antarcticum]|uniref:Uncharacterized protein n=1 Tax=Pararhizobium antarcticum TaxID=1798805 RepID=A0A657LTB2_9HYPH|nr:hypothetical protein [Pararhizobium antarcticum]OJF92682.1 hypothetical protein AX761_21020 [Rhizobium sp. 58]OJF96768.1 hypothetical protein AX760_02520 [Pararhizobium antarcticum]
MTFSAEDLASSADFFSAMRLYARDMTAMFSENPRLTSIFASQQRWLMAQAGLALYYGRDPADPASGLYAGRFVAQTLVHGIASRNTATAFVQEMLAYRFVRPSDNPPDRRMRPLEPTETTYQAVWKWLNAHLAILDGLDGGSRAERLAYGDPLFERIQPRIAEAILQNHQVRNPGETFNLFTWANSGGVVMDHFISQIEAFDPALARIGIGVLSTSTICQRYLISKTHLKRLINKAAGLQSLGIEERSGKNHLWLSQGFIREYWRYQAEKFAIIDHAFEQAVATGASALATVERLTPPTAALSASTTL